MRLKKIFVGISAVAAVTALAACSGGNSAQGGNNVQLAAGTSNVAGPASQSTTTAAPTTTTVAPTTTTTTTTTQPPVTTHPAAPKTTTQVTPVAQVSADIPCHITTGACADLSTRQAWIVQNGQVVFGPVSLMGGRKGWPTPVGTFHVTSKVVHYVSREFDAPMPYAVFFYPGVAFHEGSLYEHSHGCIHLSLSSAETFFKDLSIGETVQVIS